MDNASALDDETQAELAAAQERGRKERREATVETAPALVRQKLDLMLSAIRPAPQGRLLHMETLVVTSRALPQTERELGPEHPLVMEWRRLHDETLAWLHDDGMQRFFRNI
jgi:hypothetical protein